MKAPSHLPAAASQRCRTATALRFALTGLLLAAGGQAAFSSSATAEESHGAGMVWQIEGENATIYLAGSVHLLREIDYPLPVIYDQVYAEADRMIFEIDTAVMNHISTAIKMQELGSYQNGDTVANHLTPETYRMLEDFLRERGLRQDIFRRMKPGMLAITLSAIEATKVGARSDLGLEMTYGSRAAKDGIPTGGLETIEDQMSIFNGFTDEEADEVLRSTLEGLGTIADDLGDLIGAWKAGEVDRLDEIVNSDFEDNEKFRHAMLVNRNRNWVPQIEQAIHGDETVVFMVGAGHLIGEDSVIEMLEAKGYRPVKIGGAVPAAGVEAEAAPADGSEPAAPQPEPREKPAFPRQPADPVAQPAPAKKAA